ncbi:MAG: hybrid sensor histidine kinase/response regulator, partial [Candidatus Kariarchaeaceae archaeon]
MSINRSHSNSSTNGREDNSKDSELNLRTLFHNIPGMIYQAFPDWSAKFISGCERLTGYTPKEINAMDENWLSLIHPEDKGKIFEENNSSGIFKQPTSLIQIYRITTKMGKIRWVDDHKTSLFSEGEFMGVDGVVFDITDRKLAEDNLIKSQQYFRNLFDNMIDGFAYHKVITDEHNDPIDYMFIDINRAFTELTGLTREQVIGKLVTKALPGIEDDPANWIGRYGNVALKGTAINFESYSEPLDKTFLVHAYSPEKGYFIAIFSDITNRKKIEEDRIRLLKIESLALLSGGIAHDYNNILVGILGNTNLIQHDSSLNEEQLSILKDIENATLRASDLTKQLLTFSKGGAPITKPESIKDILSDTISFVMRGSKCKCITNFPTSSLVVDVDGGQISQVINNIILNANQAMPDGGIIKIDVTEEDLSKSKIPLPDGKYVKITIQDEGEGIPKDNIHKIFDPYFTTKSTGSGLGLAVCYSIITQHNGYIDVKSKLHEGATFLMYLPVSQKEMSTEKNEIRSRSEFAGKILLMDDDQIIQRTSKRMLERLGLVVDVV